MKRYILGSGHGRWRHRVILVAQIQQRPWGLVWERLAKNDIEGGMGGMGDKGTDPRICSREALGLHRVATFV